MIKNTLAGIGLVVVAMPILSSSFRRNFMIGVRQEQRRQRVGFVLPDLDPFLFTGLRPFADK